MIALALILLLAAALRMGAPGITEFKRDEANMMQAALDLARGRDLPLLGLSSSVNVPNSPVSVYLFAIPFVFSDSPLAATLFVGALSALAVALTWALARRYVGVRAALIAALLYAASPWGAIYAARCGRRLAAALRGDHRVHRAAAMEGRRWARIAHWLPLALTVQIHYAAASLIPLSCWHRPLAAPDAAANWPLGCCRADRTNARSGRTATAGCFDALRDRVVTDPDHARVIAAGRWSTPG